jgi:hypothetical protein
VCKATALGVGEMQRGVRVVCCARSIQLIVRAQKLRLRHSWMVTYFRAWTFAGEADFFLIALPALFWLVDPTLARKLMSYA